ncbi:MAG: hypothetical protein Q9197_002116 [Variospora fuerteventurae]
MSGWNNNDSWAANEGGPSTTWNAGATEAVDWDVGVVTTNDGAFNDNGYEAADGVEAMANGEGGVEDRACRIITTLPVEEAWANVVRTAKEAVETRDLDDFRDAIRVYQKAVKEITYEEIERSFRVNGIEIYLIATEPKDGEVLDTNTLVNLAGKRDCKYKVGYFFKKTPRTAKMAEVWPSSEEENLERLKDAGVPYERGVPKCLRCKEMGHTGRDCKQERQEFSEVTMKCFNCDEEGHRARDCKAVRVDRFACRNCKQSGHNAAECPEPRSAEGVECKRCQEVGHFAKDCPNNPGGSRACRNCGEEGHMAKECEKPKDPATATCRNCEQIGHFSKDCPEPKDWSKVKCNTCGEMGHTVKRCPQANADNEAAGVGGYDTGASGEAIKGTDGAENANGDAWGAGGGGNDETGGTSGWMTAGAAPDNWGTAPEAATVGGW